MPRDFVIWSWRHSQWWKAEHSGYTNYLHEAGRYTQGEAGEIHTSNGMGGNTALSEILAERIQNDDPKKVEAELNRLRRI